jgi:hypothetical protein
VANPRPRRALAQPPAKRRPVNCTRVAAGEGSGEGEIAAPVGTNLEVCPPAACASSTTRPLGHPRRPQTRAPKAPRRFDRIARSRTPHGVPVVFGGRSSGGVASLDPRLISVIPTGIASRDFVTPHHRTLFPRHPLATDAPQVIPCGSPVSPLHAASDRMGKRRTAPYSKWGGAAASPGERPSVSWLVETSNHGSTLLIAHDAHRARSL